MSADRPEAAIKCIHCGAEQTHRVCADCFTPTAITARDYGRAMALLINAARVSPPLRDAVATVEKYANDLDRENDLLRAHIREDVLLRLAVENGWEHEPNNPQGVWCCDPHRQAWQDGTLYPHNGSQDGAR